MAAFFVFFCLGVDKNFLCGIDSSIFLLLIYYFFCLILNFFSMDVLQKKKIGIIGGVSAVSSSMIYLRTALQYNAENQSRGKLICPEIDLTSLNMAEFKNALSAENYDELVRIFVKAMRALPQVKLWVLASNTAHCVIDRLKRVTGAQFIDGREVLAQAALKDGYHKILLLGAQFTMKKDFYRAFFEQKGLEIVVPCDEVCEHIDRLIYEKLCHGNLSEEELSTVADYLSKLMLKMKNVQGVEAAFFACTEFMLLEDFSFPIPVYDVTTLLINEACRQCYMD